MLIETSLVGLSVILIAWILQLTFSWNGNRNLGKNFLVIYMLGTALLVIDGYMNNLVLIPIVNFLTIIASAIVLIKISNKKGQVINNKTKKAKK
jgi:hypothetical protein